MADNQPVKIKQKPKLRWWWFLFIPVLIFGVLVVQAVGPNPAIRIGPNTTVISEPLRDNGLPNYGEYLLKKSADGVTHENNAAVFLWRAMWPGELSTESEQAAIVEALEMEWPDESESLEETYGPKMMGYVRDWILETVPDADIVDLEDIESQIIQRAIDRRFQKGELPFVDAWAKRNELALDWLVEGAARPKYFSPSPNAGGDIMYAWLLSDVQMMRGASRALILRAVWQISHDRHAEAWDNILASYRLSRHSCSSGQFLVANLVGIAVADMSNQALLELLDSEDISSVLLEKIQRDLDALPAFTPMHRVFAEGERFGALDIATRLSVGQHADLDEVLGAPQAMMSLVSRVRLDWNVVLEATNAWYDRFEEAAKLPFEERQVKLAQIEADLVLLDPIRNSGRLARSIFSVGARSEVAAGTLLIRILPSTQAALRAEDRAKMNQTLIRLSVALARYRDQHGEYPDNLDRLVPDFASTIPIDFYSGGKLIYQKKLEGYLLYSVFEDGMDNGGTGINGDTVRGEYVSERQSVDMSTSDLVIRLPSPRFRLPAIPTVEAASLVEAEEEIVDDYENDSTDDDSDASN